MIVSFFVLFMTGLTSNFVAASVDVPFDYHLTNGSTDWPLTDPRFAYSVPSGYPEQVHLSYNSPTSVVVSWVTEPVIKVGAKYALGSYWGFVGLVHNGVPGAAQEDQAFLVGNKAHALSTDSCQFTIIDAGSGQIALQTDFQGRRSYLVRSQGGNPAGSVSATQVYLAADFRNEPNARWTFANTGDGRALFVSYDGRLLSVFCNGVAGAPYQCSLAVHNTFRTQLFSIWTPVKVSDPVSGPYQLANTTLTPLDTSGIRSVVSYGIRGKLDMTTRAGEVVTYSQLYNVSGTHNYSSALIHHVTLTGLQPDTDYTYNVGDGRIDYTSQTFGFRTLQALDTTAFHPYRIGYVADLGTTANSTTCTIEHLGTLSNPSLVVLISDFNYADLYCSNGTLTTDWPFTMTCPQSLKPPKGTDIRESWQPRWDGLYRWLQPLLSGVPLLGAPGNHDVEDQIDGSRFAAYLGRNRFPTASDGSRLYYSVDVPKAHLIFLNPYGDYDSKSKQYAWLLADLAKINRDVTPWVIAHFHTPFYNTYLSHYKEVECFRLAYETILHDHGVDIVFSGHVHAYERTNRVYNYTLNDCGPAYLNVGDGGNVERMAVKVVTANAAACPAPRTARTQSLFDGNCVTFQPADNGAYCPLGQPAWSAYREPSFGHGTLDIIDDDTLLWEWHRNQDGVKVMADSHVFKRPTGAQCANRLSPGSNSKVGVV